MSTALELPEGSGEPEAGGGPAADELAIRHRRLLRAACAVMLLLGAFLTFHYTMGPWQGRADLTERYPYDNVLLTDLRDTTYLPRLAIWQGVDPYDIPAYRKVHPNAQEFNAYAPWWLGLTGPLAHLDWKWASLIGSAALAIGTSVLAAVAMRPALRHAGITHRRAWPWIAAAPLVVWMFRPTTIGQGLGNVGALAALAASGALLADGVAAGALLLAVAWVKPQFAVPVLIVMLAQRRWRTAAWGTGLATLVSIPAILELAPISGGLGGLVSDIIGNLTGTGARTGGEPLLGRLDIAKLFIWAGHPIGSLAATALGLVLLLVPALWLGRQLTRRGERATADALASLAVLLSFPHLHYDLPMLLPVLLTWFAVLVTNRGRVPRWHWWALPSAVYFMPPALLGGPHGYNTSLQIATWVLFLAAVVAAIVVVRTKHPEGTELPIESATDPHPELTP